MHVKVEVLRESVPGTAPTPSHRVLCLPPDSNPGQLPRPVPLPLPSAASTTSPRKPGRVPPNLQTGKLRREDGRTRVQTLVSSFQGEGSLLDTGGFWGALNQRHEHMSISQKGNPPSSSLSPISSCNPRRRHPGNINFARWLSKSSERSYTSGRWDFISQ